MNFVLVHGAWHGAWCWNRVVPLLRAGANRVISLDLPGSGEDDTPIGAVTLALCAERVCAEIERAGDEVLLIGHSMGGIVMSQAAELCPNRLRGLVYVAAFLPQHGQSLMDFERNNRYSSVPPNLIVADDEKSAVVRDERVAGLFYHDCSAEDIAYAMAHLRPQALSLFETPVATTAANWGSIPRYYIECTDDRAIHISLQRRMAAASPCRRVFSLATSHSPFFSAPQEIADILLSL